MEQATARQDAENAKTNAQLLEQIQVLKRSLLELNASSSRCAARWPSCAAATSSSRAIVADVQRRQKDISQGVDDRMRKLEPQKVSVDGREFIADPEEKRQFDEALAVAAQRRFRQGRGDVWRLPAPLSDQRLRRSAPASGWAMRCTASATTRKRSLRSAACVNNAPDHPRAPEALLAVANCQVEAKDSKGARATIDELIKAYPKSEAAQAGRERLAALK